MAYATLQDFIDAGREQELIQLTDLAGSGSVDAAMVDEAITRASGLIDNYLARRYAVPLATVPESVLVWTLDIALYRLYRDQPTETVRQRFEDALRELRDIAAGRADLAGLTPAASTGAPESSAPGRLFTIDTLSDY